jgi:BNR repeat-like domain
MMVKLISSFPMILMSIFAFFGVNNTEKVVVVSKISLCQTVHNESAFVNKVIDGDTSKNYAMPLLAKTSAGEIMLSWTEKDAKEMTSFCLSFSKDGGKTFSEKKTVFIGPGIGNNRMFRARVLSKKDGSFVAVFANRGELASSATQGGHGSGRASSLVYCISKDKGNTWTIPVSVDADPKQGIMRGFFDAIVMANDEIAVAYLKDVANSTKHEERDLRMVITKNGVFQPEKVVDAVVCDCCPVNLLLSDNGDLSVIYRDNNDDIRDMAKITSKDNAVTFGKSQIVHNDDWKIQGCPHSGAVSSTAGKNTLYAWYSGAEKESGIRLVNNEGKKLLVINETSAKNAYLVSNLKTSLLLWEQNQTENNLSQIAFRKINNNNLTETKWIEGSTNGANSTGIIIGNQVLVAFEVKGANRKNSLKMSTINL